MDTQTNHRQRLQDLSNDKLVSLLRSTYQYKHFVKYYDEHALTFLHHYQHAHPSHTRKTASNDKVMSDGQIMKQMQHINKQHHLKLHNYHLSLIFNQFANYYEQYQEQKIRRMRGQYEQKMRAVREESGLPQQLMQICLEKEGSLAKQLQSKKKKIKL